MAWSLLVSPDDIRFQARNTGLNATTLTLTEAELPPGYADTISGFLLDGVWAVVTTTATAGTRRLRLRAGPALIVAFEKVLFTAIPVSTVNGRLEMAPGLASQGIPGNTQDALPTDLAVLLTAGGTFFIQWDLLGALAGDKISEVGLRGRFLPRPASAA